MAEKSPQSQAATTASTLFAFIAGISAGAVAGMLLTPRSGSETREQLKNKMREARTKAKDKVQERKDMMKDKMEDAKEKVKKTADESRDKLAANNRNMNAAM